ncbi:S9 family peptidase [Allorhizocola rhizosphaerae]|uniref:S9 family peptidase n=1 Tax=Allorhizocola rhizosphaerae TaxID=1872709 RepID=UPI000E3BCEFE|nr:prolyl oligopeptidase family serine peptidase [Allorhizocola rhizosphaerae]
MGAEVTVSRDGLCVLHLRDGVLRACDVPSGQVRELGVGVTDYAVDRTGSMIVWQSDGEVFTEAAGRVPTIGPAQSARPDPSGRRIAYLTENTLRVIREDGADVLLAGEQDGIVWGMPDEACGYFGREEGWWWAPDGETILATRLQGDQVSLHLLDLDGGWVDVHWDREIYPYLGIVRWVDGSPLITVLRRSQSHGLVLAIDRRTGETQVHAELADPRWVNPVLGTPRHLADGRVLVGGEIAHDGYDARCLFADGTLLTPPGLYVRRVVGRLGPRAAGGELGELLIEASEGEPAEQHLYRVRGASSGAMAVHRLTTTPGWHTAECAGDTIVTGSRSFTQQGTQWVVTYAGKFAAMLSDYTPAPAPHSGVDRVTDRKLPTAVLYPAGHVFGRRLPVILLQPRTPTAQQIRADYAAFEEARRWTEAGYAVALIDGRGTVGVSPSFEKVTHRRLADLAVADQVDALRAIADKHSDLDLTHVTAVGSGYGGWLAAMLASRRPEAVQRAIAIDPWDWAQTPVPLAERYLGPRDIESEVYARHELGELPPSVLVLPGPDHQAALGFLH